MFAQLDAPFCVCDRYRAKGKAPNLFAPCGHLTVFERKNNLKEKNYYYEKCDVTEEILFCIFKGNLRGNIKLSDLM